MERVGEGGFLPYWNPFVLACVQLVRISVCAYELVLAPFLHILHDPQLFHWSALRILQHNSQFPLIASFAP